MEKLPVKDLVSIFITFVFGFVAGMYLYVTEFTKLNQPDDNVVTKEQAEAFTIISRAYGSCNSACPAFQLSADGAYRFQYNDKITNERTIKDGTLPLSLQNPLRSSLQESSLLAAAQTINPVNCNSQNGGIDISYDITVKGTPYTLNSCGTAVDGNSDLWQSLSAVWKYFETL
jgi:hypothetical protein